MHIYMLHIHKYRIGICVGVSRSAGVNFDVETYCIVVPLNYDYNNIQKLI